MTKRLVWAALALAAVLHLAASAGNPVGHIEDDSVQVLLARSLRHGAFALPDASGVPITDPLPGFALILLLPVWLLDPHWGALRAVSLISMALAALLTWRLAGRVLPRPWAGAAAALTALNPVFVRHAGLVLPDLTYLALTLSALEWSAEKRSARSRFILTAAAALAMLLRPQGALFALALATGLWKSDRRAAKAVLLGFLPLAAWLARNVLAAGTPTGYLSNWGQQASGLSHLQHAGLMVSSFFGRGLLGLEGLPLGVMGSLGVFALIAAGYGARLLLRGPQETRPLALAMASYAGLLLALHLTWRSVNYRYMMPLIPIVWIFIAAAARKLTSGPIAGSFLIVLLMSALRVDVDLARTALKRPRSFSPQTMAWIRATVPADTGVQSFKFNAVLLLGKRHSLPPPLHVQTAQQWLDDAAFNRLGYLLTEDHFRTGGYLPPGISRIQRNLSTWPLSTPGVELVYSNASEGTSVYRLPSPTP